ncbi:putative mitochondrial protein [Trifolium repens]|nr:putative mitochondrial protein [Trifolium repens]
MATLHSIPHNSFISLRSMVKFCGSVGCESIFSLCLKPLATRQALYFSTVPSGFSFFFKIHLQPIGLQPRGKSTKCHVSLDSRESMSSLIASCHRSASIDDKAS